jgi:hypothetical protein
MLPDGTKITGTFVLWAATGSAQEQFILSFFNLYRGQGFVGGWLTPEDLNESDWNGLWQWSAPASTGQSPRFNAPFSAELRPSLGANVPPAPGFPLVSWTSANFLISHGQLTDQISGRVDFVNRKIVISESNASGAKIRLSINLRTALLTGSFVHPINGRTTQIRGALNRKAERADGFFLSPSASGLFELSSDLQLP